MVYARQASWNISETAPLLGFSHKQPSPGFTENYPKKRKYPVSDSSLGKKNALLVPEVQGDWPDCFNLIIRWLIKSTCYNQGLQNAQHAKPWSRCATAPEDHTRCHSCKLRTQHWGYNLQQKTREDWRNLPTQISLSCAAIFGWCGEDFKQY